MFCDKCGEQVENGTKFCPKCGNALQGNVSKSSIPEYLPRNNKLKKVLGLIIIAVVGVTAIFTIFGKKSAEDVALDACKTTVEGKTEKYYTLLAQPYKTYMAGPDGWFDDDAEFCEELSELAEEVQDEIIDQCGEDFKTEYQVTRVEKCTKETLDYVKSELSRDYDYEPDLIKDAAVVTISIKASGEEGAGLWTHEQACVKIGSSWYIHRPGFSSI